MTTTQTPYDLDRAARAGGFGHDLEAGREVARHLHAVLIECAKSSQPYTLKDVVTRTLHEIADLWEDDATANTLWLATMSNALNAMLRDLAAQVSEANARRDAA